MKHIPRFYVAEKLCESQKIKLSEDQRHHAVVVLRVSGEVHLFNENDGEWSAFFDESGKNVILHEKIAEPKKIECPTLACCLINPNRFSIILEKATELGVNTIIPVVSQFTQYHSLNYRKCRQILISAAEQCGRTSIPELEEIITLPNLLDEYGSRIVVGDLSPNSGNISTDSIILVGPEGGFSESERQMFREKNVATFHLGSYILRSETAAIALLALGIQR